MSVVWWVNVKGRRTEQGISSTLGTIVKWVQRRILDANRLEGGNYLFPFSELCPARFGSSLDRFLG